LASYPFSIIVPTLKVKVGIHLKGLFMINIACLATGPGIKALFDVLTRPK